MGARKLLPRFTPADRSWLAPLLTATSELDADTRTACEAAIARRTLACQVPGRAGFWDSIAVAELPKLPAEGTLLLFHGRLSPDEGVVDALELFAAFAGNAAAGHLVIAGDRPVRAFADYLEYLLATRFTAIKERVSLFADLDDGQLKALYRRCDALIHLGVDAALRLEEAVHFAKPLFTSGSAVPHAGYRLYGTNRELQAARLRHFLNDSHVQAELVDQQRRSLAGLDSSPGDVSIWDLLETAAARVAGGSGSVR
jgi:glycosyltransferase involved in cell wall biosynthesis